MTTEELLNLSLTEVSRRVARREISPVELVDASVARIEQVGDELAAFIAVYADEAREAAKAMEALIAADHNIGPLHGIPVALKDNIGIRGRTTTAGSKVLSDWEPEVDATVVTKLKGAGSIILGKTNMHEFAWGGTSANPHFGFVRNPWDTDRFPAGSSGGSGAAIAARCCYGALGTDTGGSVRLPAAVNGVVGLRPTIGRVSNYGVIPLAYSMDTVGPMTRTVEDNAMMLSILAGHDRLDGGSAQHPADDYLADLGRGVQGVRIGIVSGYFFHHLQPAVHRSVRGAVEALEKAGATVVEVEMAHIHGNISAQLTIESTEPSAYHQRWLREQPESYGDDVRTLLEVGELLLATHYIQAQRYRNLLREEFLNAFRDVDVFICPTLPFTATRVGETEVIIEEGKPEDMLSAIMQFTGVPSLTGLPSLNVPCGFDDDGLPVGMQIIGAPFSERSLYRVGAAFQREADLHERVPPL